MHENSDVSWCYSNDSIPNNNCRSPFNPCTGLCHVGYTLYQFDQIMRKPSSLITYGQIYPALLVVTVVANIFVAIVLSRKHMQSPTNLVLLYMAIADLGVALVPFPFIFFYILVGSYQNLANMQLWWCYLAMYTAESIPPFCHNVAIWLTVLLAAQRYIYIKLPLRAAAICSIKRVRIAAVIIIIASALVSIPKFVDITSFKLLKWEMYDVNGTLSNSNYKCIFTYSRIVKLVGLNIYFSFYYWTRVILFVLVPSFLLIIFSLLLILGIHEANVRRRKMFRDILRRESAKNKEKNTVNLMLLIIVLIFLVVNLPQGIMLALICFRQVFGNLQMDQNTVLLVTNVDNMLILATYPINFAIYCGMSAQFRETFKQIFKRGPPNLLLMEKFRSSRALILNDGMTDAERTALPLLKTRRTLASINGEATGAADIIL